MRAFLVNAIFLGMPENEIYEEMQKIFEEMQKIFEEMQKTEVSCASSVGRAVAAWPEALVPGQGNQWSGPKGRADQQGYTWVWIQIRFLSFSVF